MIEIKDLSISINDRYLVKSLSFNLNNNDKLAIIGEEGNGKSTLLKCILGICDYANISGIINLNNNRIGYLAQTVTSDKKVFDYLFSNQDDYYNKVNSLYKYLDLININDSIFNQIFNTLSGGEKVKVNILKLLLEDYDILFLDEPTNDLDIETLEWLEDFINKCSKPIIYISHDETLLSNTANMILHLEQIKNKSDCRHTIMKIDYDTYVENRINSINKQTQVARSEKREFKKKEDKLKQVMNIVHHRQNTISRSDPFGAAILKRKMKSLKVQERRLNNKELTEMPDVEEGINFFFEDVFIPNTKVILDLKLDTLSIDDKVLSKDINLNIIGNKKICIIGRNGCGKSTLIKEIYNILKEREDISVGYMPQNYDDILDNYEYVLDFICDTKDKDTITKVRMNLGNMKFTKEEMIGK